MTDRGERSCLLTGISAVNWADRLLEDDPSAAAGLAGDDGGEDRCHVQPGPGSSGEMHRDLRFVR
jgi:hypothetical protein